MLVLQDQELVCNAIRLGDHQTLLTLVSLPNDTVPVTSASMPGILRSGLEQLGHARQTAGNVAGLGRLLGIRASTSPTDLLAVARL